MSTTRSPRHKVTFSGYSDAHCVALAMLGQSTKVIARDTKLSPSQIQYRLNKAKNLEGNKHGYRVAWRSGESPVVRRIKDDMLAVLRQDVQRSLPKQIEHQPVKKSRKI